MKQIEISRRYVKPPINRESPRYKISHESYEKCKTFGCITDDMNFIAYYDREKPQFIVGASDTEKLMNVLDILYSKPRKPCAIMDLENFRSTK